MGTLTSKVCNAVSALHYTSDDAALFHERLIQRHLKSDEKWL